jgi:hypothetical protein
MSVTESPLSHFERYRQLNSLLGQIEHASETSKYSAAANLFKALHNEFSATPTSELTSQDFKYSENKALFDSKSALLGYIFNKKHLIQRKIDTLSTKISKNKSSIIGKIFNIFHRHRLNSLNTEFSIISKAKADIEDITIKLEYSYDETTIKNFLSENGFNTDDARSVKLGEFLVSRGFSTQEKDKLLPQEYEYFNNLIIDSLEGTRGYDLGCERLQLDKITLSSHPFCLRDLEAIELVMSDSRVQTDDDIDAYLKSEKYDQFLSPENYQDLKQKLVDRKLAFETSTPMTRDNDRKSFLRALNKAYQGTLELNEEDILSGKNFAAKFLRDKSSEVAQSLTMIRAQALIKNLWDLDKNHPISKKLSRFLVQNQVRITAYSNLLTVDDKLAFKVALIKFAEAMKNKSIESISLFSILNPDLKSTKIQSLEIIYREFERKILESNMESQILLTNYLANISRSKSTYKIFDILEIHHLLTSQQKTLILENLARKGIFTDDRGVYDTELEPVINTSIYECILAENENDSNRYDFISRMKIINLAPKEMLLRLNHTRNTEILPYIKDKLTELEVIPTEHANLADDYALYLLDRGLVTLNEFKGFWDVFLKSRIDTFYNEKTSGQDASAESKMSRLFGTLRRGIGK